MLGILVALFDHIPAIGYNKSYCPVLMAVLGRSNSYCQVLMALSGPLLAVTHHTAQSWWLFLVTLGRNKSYCWVLVAISGPRIVVTNGIAGSWWLFAAGGRGQGGGGQGEGAGGRGQGGCRGRAGARDCILRYLNQPAGLNNVNNRTGLNSICQIVQIV